MRRVLVGLLRVFTILILLGLSSSGLRPTSNWGLSSIFKVWVDTYPGEGVFLTEAAAFFFGGSEGQHRVLPTN